MFIITVRNPYLRAALFLLPLIIAAIVYFAVIKPSTDTANDTLKSSAKQATEQLRQAAKNAPASSQKALENAQKLTACIADAGTDTGKLSDCRDKFGG